MNRREFLLQSVRVETAGKAAGALGSAWKEMTRALREATGAGNRPANGSMCLRRREPDESTAPVVPATPDSNTAGAVTAVTAVTAEPVAADERVQRILRAREQCRTAGG